MTAIHENVNEYRQVRLGGDRQFGLTMAGVCLLWGLFPLIHQHNPRLSVLVVGGVILLLALVKPGLLKPMNLLWHKLGLLLGRVMTPVVMAVLFFGLFFPIGVLLRLFKGGLRLSFDKRANSYWVERKSGKLTADSLKMQF